MIKKLMIPVLLLFVALTSCKKDEPDYDFNLSATTWKGTRVQGSSGYSYIFIFNADGTLGGNVNFNGAPQKFTGTWTQDRNKVSANYVTEGYVGTWRGEGAIDDAKTGMVYKGYSSQGAVLDFTVNLTLQ